MRQLGPRTRRVAITHKSNALGTINPVREIAALVRSKADVNATQPDGATALESVLAAHSLGDLETRVEYLRSSNAAQSEVFEQALAEVGVPYQVRGGERFFQRAEVRQAMVALRSAAAHEPTGELPKVVREVLAGIGLTDEPPAGGTAREKWESLLALVELAEELVTTVDSADLRTFVGELELRAEAQHPPTVEGVTLASLHAAKGLEWDAVFLVGLVEGTLPIQHADGDDAAIEEERRLLYVGVTRAREHLWLSWALARAAGGRRYRRRSRFLYGLVPDDHPASRTAAKREPLQKRPKPQCRVCGSALVDARAIKLSRCASCPSDLDEELLAKLRAWRADRARELKVPAYVVFTDATLVAVAETRPTDVAGLARESSPELNLRRIDAVFEAQISLSTVTTGWQAGPGATGTVTVFEVNAPVVSVPVAVLATSDTVQAVLAARIDILAPEEKRALQRAAVVEAMSPITLEEGVDLAGVPFLGATGVSQSHLRVDVRHDLWRDESARRPNPRRCALRLTCSCPDASSSRYRPSRACHRSSA